MLDGERDAEALVEAHDLDSADYLVLTKTLEAIRELPDELEAGDVKEGAAGDAASAEGSPPDREEELDAS